MTKEKDATINLGMAVLIAMVVVCAIGLLTLLIIKWGGSSDRKVVNEIAEEREAKRADLETGMDEELSSYRMISEEKGTVQIPLALSMQVTLDDLQQQQPQASSVPVDPTAAVAAPTTEVTEETAPAEVEAEPAAETEAVEVEETTASEEATE
ncbi:MAG: hypothetical protein AAF571_11300 [Verrucomicrobiota bacterium]